MSWEPTFVFCIAPHDPTRATSWISRSILNPLPPRFQSKEENSHRVQADNSQLRLSVLCRWASSVSLSREKICSKSSDDLCQSFTIKLPPTNGAMEWELGSSATNCPLVSSQQVPSRYMSMTTLSSRSSMKDKCHHNRLLRKSWRSTILDSDKSK